MISHITVGSNDLGVAREFYGKVLATLGQACVHDETAAVAFGAAGTDRPWLWIVRPFDGQPASFGNGTHVAFLAPSRSAVRAFHAAALAAGGSDEGAPGLRPHYSEHYYGAYVRDPDGNKLQSVCYEPE